MASILDGIINGIFGPDTSQMSEADRSKTEKARSQDKADASHMAASARFNPGEQFMYGPEKAGLMENGDLLQTIGKIFKMFGGGGG